MSSEHEDVKFATQAIHAGESFKSLQKSAGDVVVPIHLSSTFARESVEIPTNGYEYSRSGNPTRFALEAKLAALEQAKYGLAFASGLAAETSILSALLQAGDHMIAADDLYGGTKRLFDRVFAEKFKVEISYCDFSKAVDLAAYTKNTTKLVWLETPTNPLLKLADIKTIAAHCKKHELILVVDNTFMSPYFQRPISMGADIVLHSTTKYINGHSDSVGGAVITDEETLFEKIQFIQNSMGAILSPFDSYLVARGIKTLAIRMATHEKNALELANYLQAHSKVKRVIYPGLSTHPQHHLAKKQMYGFGGMISFELDANLQSTQAFIERLNLIAVAESLGGVESLIELPALMTHASIDITHRKKLGLTDSLVRLSVGIENVSDLLNDLEASLAKL